MSEIASQITSLTIVYSTVLSGADQSKHQSSASLAFVWEIHRWPVNFPHKWPVTRKIFPFDDVIMRPVSQIPQYIWSMSHNAPFRTEICTFMFWMMYCGILFRCPVGFVTLACSTLGFYTINMHVIFSIQVIRWRHIVRVIRMQAYPAFSAYESLGSVIKEFGGLPFRFRRLTDVTIAREEVGPLSPAPRLWAQPLLPAFRLRQLRVGLNLRLGVCGGVIGATRGVLGHEGRMGNVRMNEMIQGRYLIDGA